MDRQPIQHFPLEDLLKESVSDILTKFSNNTSNIFLPHITKTLQIHFVMVKAQEITLCAETTVLAKLSGN